MEKKSTKKSAVIDGDVNKSAKQKALETAIEQIEKTYGKGSIMKLSDTNIDHVEVISTGCISIDMALGIGGLPRGRIIEIYGPESSGKTTLSLHVIAEAQKAGGNVAFIDAEHALDPVYASHLGINISELYISQPDNGEQALDICESLVRSGAMDVIVVDSVAALTPKVEIDGEMGESHIGLQARLMSQALRKLAGICNKTKTCIIFINQLREKVGVMFGNPEVTPGGKALKFYSSIRIDVRKVDTVKSGTEIVGNKVKIKIVKNKLAPPFKVAEVEIIYGKGISNASAVFELALQYGLLEKSGSWFSYKGERIGQGKETIKNMIETDKSFADELVAAIREKVNQNPESGFEDPALDNADEQIVTNE
ncbi:MAG: recombinase RecA [Firmicutes bacterium]|nr:recombinase RecA [Bacillota bacterium]MDY5531861.1 recombinase RecA [Pumilibacteraceae bacterium]